jgi:hypothetical protein
MTNTIQELELIKRTAWMNANRDPRQATQEEADKITPNVISAIVYCAALNGLIYDFKDALVADRTHNDCVKKVLRMFHHKAQYAHGEIYRVFNNAINGFGKLYNERYDLTMQAIEEHVGMSGGLKYYNIILALLRLIEKNNNACGRFRSPALIDLYPYIRRLTECKLPYEDKGEVIERIIDSASQEVIQLTRFKKILTE